MTPAAQLTGFLAKYTPQMAAQARAVLAAMRKRLPGALELVYDNYNALVVGFGASERASGIVFSIAVYPRWVTLFFAGGARLPDPHRRLGGDGKRVRQIRLDNGARDLADPQVRALMDEALARASTPIDKSAKRRLIIKSISAKQRPRRPA
jgi:hypothetical protein